MTAVTYRIKDVGTTTLFGKITHVLSL